MGEQEDKIFERRGGADGFKLRCNYDVLYSIIAERGIQAVALGTALIIGFTVGAVGAVWTIKAVYGGIPIA